ncbi:hypothetical protein [uncultured Marinobacter sp.]|uniref:hypothetical protein n=1 Tax=uncultured Marinobacter sp. TaxID=187379 RepID=UPI0030DD52A9|tara:strand:- start:64663 stop:64935 length:273 start_codon:yes stop_codon:yes gene_type:complete
MALSSGNPGPTEVKSLQNQLMTFFPPLLHQITPTAINLLSSLSDEQARELADNMANKHRELEAESLVGRHQSTINDWSENHVASLRVAKS